MKDKKENKVLYLARLMIFAKAQLIKRHSDKGTIGKKIKNKIKLEKHHG